MLEPERRKELISELLEASDGTRADDYATVTLEFEEMQSELDRRDSEIKKLTDSNAALKKENFRLFERVGIRKEEDILDVPDDPEIKEEPPKDYLKDVLDENGFFK